MKFLSTLLILICITTVNAYAEQTDSKVSLTKPIEEVVVNGRRPGPPLWRIENGDNTLWVFALVSPMPKTFEWDSKSIEHVLSGSQEYFPLIEKKVGASILNPIKAIGMVRRFNKLKKIPDDRTLKDYLSSETYDKFLTLKTRYLPTEKKLDSLTPLFVAEQLYKGAKREYGLIEPRKISKTIDKLAKRNKLEITKIKVGEKIESKPLLDALENLSAAEHARCLSSVMNTLDNEIESLINYALLWVEGDQKALVNNSQPRMQDSCADFFMRSEQAQRILSKSEELWLNATEEALENNSSSFAVLELHQVIEPKGLLSQLSARGYKIVGPVRSSELTMKN